MTDNSKGRSPGEMLERGAAELAEVLGPAGFEFIHAEQATNNGEQMAIGEFFRGDRRMELGFRSKLSLVRYHFGEESLSHEDLVRGVRALEGISAEGEYPGFSADPMAAFHHLRRDLDRFGAIFLRGGAKAFRALNKWVNKHPRKGGLAGLT